MHWVPQTTLLEFNHFQRYFFASNILTLAMLLRNISVDLYFKATCSHHSFIFFSFLSTLHPFDLHIKFISNFTWECNKETLSETNLPLLVIINPAEVLGLSSADVTAVDVAILELDVTLDWSEHTGPVGVGPVGVDAVVAGVKEDGSVDEEFEVDGELEVDEELEVEMTNKHSEEGGSCSGFTSLSSDIFLFFPLMEM